MGNEMIFLE